MMNSRHTFLSSLVSILLLAFTSQVFAQEKEVSTGQWVIIEKGESAERIFGDLSIKYQIAPSGLIAQCTLYVVTQFVGVYTFSENSPKYEFDVALGYGEAKGHIQMILRKHTGYISVLRGNFSYTSYKDKYKYKGDLIGWIIEPKYNFSKQSGNNE